jgi:hypothetical protein
VFKMSKQKELLKSQKSCKWFQEQEKPWINFCKKYYTEGSPNGSIADRNYLSSIIYTYVHQQFNYNDLYDNTYNALVKVAVDNFIASLNLKVKE